MSKIIKRKQPTLAAFGFTKNVMHRGEMSAIRLPLEAVETSVECKHCKKLFKSQQGLAFHVKVIHGISKQDCKHSQSQVLQRNEELITLAVKDVLNNIVNKVVSEMKKSEESRQLAGKKRHQYTAAFKAEAINAYGYEANQETIAESFGVTQSQISRWLKKKETIIKDAESSYRRLFLKGRRSTKYLELYEAIYNEFLQARSKGHIVNFSWLWSKARNIQLNIDPNVEIKLHVIVRFLQKKELKMRSKQRNKRKHKKEMEPLLQKWHATFREKCIRTGSKDPSYDKKWGRYQPGQRLNVDQSPLPFVVHGKKTYEYVPKGQGATYNTWISQPGSGLEKRQCSLQIMFRPEGEQPKLAIIFRGQGKRISKDEKLAWHKDIHVYFQQNAWLDQNVCKHWCDKTLLPFVKEQKLDKFVLLLDNLKGQMQEDFKDAVAAAKGLLWYGLPSATDLWQPVDAGYAATLKRLITIEHQKWLDRDNHSDRWFSNEMPYTAKERRILITHWAGEAWKALNTSKYDKQRKKCWTMTGCLMTSDGSEDSLVKPEGLDCYKVPPPSIIDPGSDQPIGNQGDIQPVEVDDAINESANEILPDDTFIGPDEKECEVHIFDFIDNICI
ncbi:jerky protein homolog-like [Hydra vulgaris]|uniref:Jerky protein homolog-like n=1 Tax=Hydra vulgaris TaxID=6087 RepID=A0ABM4CAR2_HYDVU